MKILKAFTIMALLAVAQIQGVYSQSTRDAFANSYAHETKKLYAEAIKDLQAVYEVGSYEINLRIGWLCYMEGRLTDSQKYYETAVKLQPYAIEPKFGYIYPAIALENWDGVKKKYEEILAIDSHNTLALYGLGNIYYYREDYANAYTNFEKVVNLYPFDPSSLLMLGWTNLRLGKAPQAKALFNKVLICDPSNKSAQEGMDVLKGQ